MQGQNLIPNPGFEEVFTEQAYQWVQPQGAYYHYEKTDSITLQQAHSGEYVNGLCMYNNQENEFLHVRLLNSLEKGITYKLSFYARLMRAKCFNADVHQLIGIYFGSSEVSTHIPGDLYFEPQLNLELPDSNRFEWFELKGTYTAEGGEQYITIGYFAATQTEEIRRSNKSYEVPPLVTQQESNKLTDKSWLYLSPEEQKKFIKEQKKKKSKRKKQSTKNLDSPNFEKPKSAWRQTPSQGKNSDVRFFQVRYYFDDFCLAKIDSEGSANCISERTPVKLKKGESINLRNVFFETGKANLLKESVVQLVELKQILDRRPTMKIELRGYTDNKGSDEINEELSLSRASSVRDWLIEYGIDERRINAVGFGRKDPIASNQTKAGRARNRRVEFYIVEM